MEQYAQEEIENLLEENLRLENRIKKLKNENEKLLLRVNDNKEYLELFKQLRMIIESEKIDIDDLLNEVEQEVLKFANENTLYNSKDVKNLLQKTLQKIDELKTNDEKIILQEIRKIKMNNKNNAEQIVKILSRKIEKQDVNYNCEVSNADLFLYFVGILTTVIGFIAIIKNLLF